MRSARPSRLALALSAALLALAALVVAPGIASAHARYTRSAPAAGAVLRTAPARVDMWTDSEMFRQAQANTLTVTGPTGAVANEGPSQLDDADRTHLWVALQPGLRPGLYTVAWRTVSADDQEVATGTFSFTVDPNATPSAGAAAATSGAAVPTSPPGGGVPTKGAVPDAASTTGRGFAVPPWAVITLLALLAAGAVAAFAILRAPPGGDRAG